MAARAGSVHLISSMDRKPSRKGGARPRPKQHHPAPQKPSFSIKCRLHGHRMSTGSPQSIPIKTHSFLKARTHTNTRRPLILPHRPHKSSPHFLCGRGNNTSSQPHPLQTIVSLRPAVQSPRSHRRTVPH